MPPRVGDDAIFLRRLLRVQRTLYECAQDGHDGLLVPVAYSVRHEQSGRAVEVPLISNASVAVQRRLCLAVRQHRALKHVLALVYQEDSRSCTRLVAAYAAI